MKILQLGKFYPVKGGVEKVMYDLMKGLSEMGVDCDMMCACADGGGTRVIRQNGHAELICCRTLCTLASTTISPSLLSTLRSRCGDYDIIHVHHPDPMACLALRRSGYRGRVVLHWHSDILRQRILGMLYRPLQSWLIDRADVIIGTSPVYIEQSPDLKKARAKSHCIPIGVLPLPYDRDAAAAVRARYPGKKIVFSLGRLVKYKGHSTLIEAARHLGDDYVVLIGGEGPLRTGLEAQIRESGLQDKVKLLGFISDCDLPSVFHACDVFCLSSIQKTEAFGIAQIEAMSCGKPVVATNIPGSGTSWVNEHGVSGLNADPGDADALAGAIRAVTKDAETYARYSENALSRYKALFTRQKMLNDSLRVYEKLCQC